ncbi:MAG: biotin--[Bacteroidaceae bacterium]|nr:biotin--[acetyl-CoA-carboxylase] ligase [Bacteroidaceae bacterium]
MDDNSLKYYLKHLACIDSTNRYIKDEAIQLAIEAPYASAFVVTADKQTAGRGQRGNSWQSQGGENLLMSIMLYPTFLKVREQFLLSQVAALSVKATMAHYGIDAILKWPNDIYAGNRKLCGILVELSSVGDNLSDVVVGIGLNVNQMQFAPMDKVPVSMRMLKGEEYAVAKVRDVLLQEFSRYYSLLQSGSSEVVCKEYINSLLGYGEAMQYRDAAGTFFAAIEGIAPMGNILLRRTDGSLSSYAFKEVELLL